MSFEKNFNKTIKLKIASIILFIVSILCAGGAFVTGLYLSNMISDNFEITEEFTFSIVNTREEDGKIIYDYNVVGSFSCNDLYFIDGLLTVEFLINDNGTSYSTKDHKFDITTPIAQNEVYNANFNFSDFNKYIDVFAVQFQSNGMKFTLMDGAYNKMFNNLFLPLIIIGGACFITSLALSISYTVKKKQITNKVSTIQTTLQTTINTMKQKETEELHCPYCNTKIEKTDKKCPSCGATL